MKSYLIKNKKYTFMIIFFICSFFCIGKVDALVYKNGWWYGTIDSAQKTGTLSATGNATARFNVNVNEVNGDYIGFNFDVFDFHNVSNSSTNSYIHYCTKWEQYQQTSPIIATINECKATATDTITNISSPMPEYTISFQIYDSTGLGHWCFLSSEYGGGLICPTKNMQNIDHFNAFIYTKGNPGGSVSYSIGISKSVFWLNNDSTDIITALNGLGTIQQNTTTTIQNFNNYVSNTDTTTSTANSNTALSGMNSEFSTHLSQMNELTQLTMLPITFINSLLTNSCQPLVWDIPFVNSRVVVPCMSTIYNGYFSALVSTFSLIMTALLGYRAFIRLFNAIKGIVDAEDDKLEVVDL